MTTIHTKSKAAAPSTTSTIETPATPAVISLAPPPKTAAIPLVPPGFVATGGAQFIAVVPKATEQSSLPLAIQDIRRFTTYGQRLGTTAPSYEEVLDAFTIANEWSTMRVATEAWDGYSIVQEGVAWQSLRAHMDRLRPAFDLAVAGDPTIATQFPGLAAFLGAKKVIARRSASTRQANKVAEAKGEAPFHGTVGKKRKKAAEKAALVASTATVATPVAAEPVVATTVATAATPVAGTNATHS